MKKLITSFLVLTLFLSSVTTVHAMLGGNNRSSSRSSGGGGSKSSGGGSKSSKSSSGVSGSVSVGAAARSSSTPSSSYSAPASSSNGGSYTYVGATSGGSNQLNTAPARAPSGDGGSGNEDRGGGQPSGGVVSFISNVFSGFGTPVTQAPQKSDDELRSERLIEQYRSTRDSLAAGVEENKKDATSYCQSNSCATVNGTITPGATIVTTGTQPRQSGSYEFNLRGVPVSQSNTITQDKKDQEQRDAQGSLSLNRVLDTVLPNREEARASNQRVADAVAATNSCLQGGGGYECAARAQAVSALSDEEKKRLNDQINRQPAEAAVVEAAVQCDSGITAACANQDALQNLLGEEASRLAQIAVQAQHNVQTTVATTLSSEQNQRFALAAATCAISDPTECVGQIIDKPLSQAVEQAVNNISSNICIGDQTCRDEVTRIANEEPQNLQKFTTGRELLNYCQGDEVCNGIVAGIQPTARDEVLSVVARVPTKKSIVDTGFTSTAQQVAAGVQALDAAAITTREDVCGAPTSNCGIFEDLSPQQQQEIMSDPTSNLPKILDLDPHVVGELRRHWRQDVGDFANAFGSNLLDPIEQNSSTTNYLNSIQGQPIYRQPEGYSPPELVSPDILDPSYQPPPEPRINASIAELLQGQLEQARGITPEEVQQLNETGQLQGLPFAQLAANNPVVAGVVTTTAQDFGTLMQGFGEAVFNSPKTLPTAFISPNITAYQASQPIAEAWQIIRERHRDINLADVGIQSVANIKLRESQMSSDGASRMYTGYVLYQGGANLSPEEQAIHQEAGPRYVLVGSEQKFLVNATQAFGAVVSTIGGFVTGPSVVADTAIGGGVGTVQTLVNEAITTTPNEMLAIVTRQHLNNTTDPTIRQNLRNDLRDINSQEWDRRLTEIPQEIVTNFTANGIMAGVGSVVRNVLSPVKDTGTEAAAAAAREADIVVAPTEVTVVPSRPALPTRSLVDELSTRWGNFEDDLAGALGIQNRRIGEGLIGVARRSDAPLSGGGAGQAGSAPILRQSTDEVVDLSQMQKIGGGAEAEVYRNVTEIAGQQQTEIVRVFREGVFNPQRTQEVIDSSVGFYTRYGGLEGIPTVKDWLHDGSGNVRGMITTEIPGPTLSGVIGDLEKPTGFINADTALDGVRRLDRIHQQVGRPLGDLARFGEITNPENVIIDPTQGMRFFDPAPDFLLPQNYSPINELEDFAVGLESLVEPSQRAAYAAGIDQIFAGR